MAVKMTCPSSTSCPGIRRSRFAVAARMILVVAAGISVSSCRVQDMLDRANSEVDAYQERPPTDPTPEGPLPVPLDDGKDWIQLKSGEWLRGEILRIRDETLDFDSDELDEQSFDFEDVKQVRSPRSELILTTDNRIFRGTLTIDGDKVWVAGERTVQLTRDEILSSLSVDDNNAANITGGLSIGATARSGNNDQQDYTAGFNFLRESARTRATSKYAGAVSTSLGVEVTNNHRLDNAFDIFLSQRWFVTLPGIGFYSDRLQNIDLRTTLFAGIGYAVVDTKNHELRLTLGPGYQITRLDTVGVGVDDTGSTAAMQISSDYEWTVTKDVDFALEYDITVPLPETSQYNHNFISSLKFDITDNIDFDVSFVWDRVNMPVADSGFTVPRPNDYRTTIGVTWKF